MRVRHLHSYLKKNLSIQGNVQQLCGLRLGIDVVFWLRSLSDLKEPLAEPIGGLPPNFFGVLDEQIANFNNHQIKAVFVFQGIQPRTHSLFTTTENDMYQAWRNLANNNANEAFYLFSQAISRINSDSLQFIFHYLKSQGCECFQAPYLAAAQLAYFVEHDIVDAVFGLPSILVYNVPRAITHLDLKNGKFHFVDLSYMLRHWAIRKDQFVSACLLAGTEYCRTFPYLNLRQFQHEEGFSFKMAIEFIQQAHMSDFMVYFPTPEMRTSYCDGYTLCKALIQTPLVANFDGTIGPSKPPKPQGGEPLPAPSIFHDYNEIVGDRLPDALYWLLVKGVLTRKLPTALATGEWMDFSSPAVDTQDYQELLTDIQSYRLRALGLIASALNEKFRTKLIKFSRYSLANNQKSTNEPRLEETGHQPPKVEPGLAWSFTTADVQAELKRQDRTEVSIKFCLQWHSSAAYNGKQLIIPGTYVTSPWDVMKIDSEEILCALVHFMLLECLDYFTKEGGITAFGLALMDAPDEFQEHCLFALELIKFGYLFCDPYEAPKERPFPEEFVQKRLAREQENPDEKHVVFLTRVMSLLPMVLSNKERWFDTVEFDLAAFHSFVKVLKRSLRQLMEASLTNLLLRDLSLHKFLPENYLNPLNPKLPCFMLPRNCLGIVFKYMLDWKPPPDCGGKTPLELFSESLKTCFSACAQPIEDIAQGIRFWNAITQITERLVAEGLDAACLQGDLVASEKILVRKLKEIGWDFKEIFSNVAGSSATAE